MIRANVIARRIPRFTGTPLNFSLDRCVTHRPDYVSLSVFKLIIGTDMRIHARFRMAVHEIRPGNADASR